MSRHRTCYCNGKFRDSIPIAKRLAAPKILSARLTLRNWVLSNLARIPIERSLRGWDLLLFRVDATTKPQLNKNVRNLIPQRGLGDESKTRAGCRGRPTGALGGCAGRNLHLQIRAILLVYPSGFTPFIPGHVATASARRCGKLPFNGGPGCFPSTGMASQARFKAPLTSATKRQCLLLCPTHIRKFRTALG